MATIEAVRVKLRAHIQQAVDEQVAQAELDMVRYETFIQSAIMAGFDALLDGLFPTRPEEDDGTSE